MIISDRKVLSMSLVEKYIELKNDLKSVKKQMVFEFAQHLNTHYSIVLYVEDNKLLIRTDNLKYQNIFLIGFFEDEFKDYHEHAGLLFEFSELVNTQKKLENFELGTLYFLNFVDIF